MLDAIDNELVVRQHEQGLVFHLPATPELIGQFEEQGIEPLPVLQVPQRNSMYDEFREDKILEYTRHIASSIYFCSLNGELYDGDDIGILQVFMEIDEAGDDIMMIRVDCPVNNDKMIYGGRLVYRDDNYTEDISQFIIKILKKIYKCPSCTTYEVFSSLSKDWCKECYYMDMYKCPNDNCSICMEPLESKPRFLTECNHYFHISCLTGLKASNRKKKCPLCRTMFSATRNMNGNMYARAE